LWLASPAIHQAQSLIWSSKAPDQAPSGADPLRELSSMELWRTDEIAPVVLLILFELMMLGLINYAMPI
jgi:hypothetical protein